MFFYVFLQKIPWECIANVLRKLYVKYKSNPMNNNWDISKQKALMKKGLTDPGWKSQPLCLKLKILTGPPAGVYMFCLLKRL